MPLTDLHQTTTPATALTGFLARLLDPAGAPGEGLFYGGATAVGDLPSGTSYPAFLALVNDDLGQTWPVGDVNPSAITFVDAAGACTLYLSPFSTSELPTAQAGRLGAFTLLAQLTASDPPSDCLVLGSGTVTAGAFTTWTEAAGVRRDSLSAGSGKGGDITFYARTGAANPPGLRFHSATSQWQYSTDGTTWHTLGEGGVTSFNGRTGAVTPQSGDYTAAQVGAVPTTRTISAGTGLTGGGDLSADRSLAVSYGSTAGTAAQGNDSRLSDARTPTAHAASHAAGQSDAVTPSAIGAIASTAREAANGVAGLDSSGKLTGSRQIYGTLADTACAGNDSRLSGNAKLDAAENIFTGYLVLTNGKQRTVAAAGFGPPSTGTFTEGDRYWDAAGAQWYYTAGTPGSWLQISIGTATGTWDTTGKISGYRIYEPGVGVWEYSSTAANWLGARQEMSLPPGAAGVPGQISAQTDPAFIGTFDPRCSVWIEKFSLWYYTSGDYTSKKWELILYPPGGSPIGTTLTIQAAAAGGTRAWVDVNALSTTHGLFVRATPTNTPPNLGLWGAGITFREVR